MLSKNTCTVQILPCFNLSGTHIGACSENRTLRIFLIMKYVEKSRKTSMSYYAEHPCSLPNLHVLQSRLVSGVLMHRPYELTLLFVQASFQESRFIWPTCWELFGCLASCVQIGLDYRISFLLDF